MLLGCVADAAGCILRWVELWVQSLDGLASSPASAREALSNAVLDRRWTEHAAACEAVDAGGVIRTGWEARHPPPVVIDIERLEAITLAHDSGQAWALCEDEKILASRGAAPFGSSLHRYLYVPSMGESSPLAAVTPGTPAIGAGKDLASLLGPSKVNFNAGCGLLMARTWRPMPFEEFVDALASEPSSAAVRMAPPLGESSAGNDAHVLRPYLDGSMILARHGRRGRLVESFHLRLGLLADAIAAVREVTRGTQAPMLNLASSSFRVGLSGAGGSMPVLWSASAALVEGSDAVSLNVPGADLRVFLRGRDRGVTIYSPESAGRSVQAIGSFRVRQIEPGRAGVIVTGTLTTQERLSPVASELAWLRLDLPGVMVDLYGVLESATALASGEWRFRSLQQRLADAAVSALKEREGVPIHDACFETLPQLSSPCDLYSLAVLAVRTLLVNGRNTLAVALDEMLSLARQCAMVTDAKESLAERIGDLMDKDRRWVDSLGPQRLTREDVSPEAALDLIPREIWLRTLSLIVRMFPGVGADSSCRDLGDANPSAPHAVFDESLEELRRLIVETRSLIVIDWRFNREIHSVVRDVRMGLSPGKG